MIKEGRMGLTTCKREATTVTSLSYSDNYGTLEIDLGKTDIVSVNAWDQYRTGADLFTVTRHPGKAAVQVTQGRLPAAFTIRRYTVVGDHKAASVQFIVQEAQFTADVHHHVGKIQIRAVIVLAFVYEVAP